MPAESCIIDGARSPIGLKNGGLIGMRPDDLASDIIKELLKRNQSMDHKNIEDIAVKYDTFELEHDHESKMRKDFGPVYFLKMFL